MLKNSDQGRTPECLFCACVRVCVCVCEEWDKNAVGILKITMHMYGNHPILSSKPIHYYINFGSDSRDYSGPWSLSLSWEVGGGKIRLCLNPMRPYNVCILINISSIDSVSMAHSGIDSVSMAYTGIDTVSMAHSGIDTVSMAHSGIHTVSMAIAA